MKKYLKIRKIEVGQVIPLVVLMMFVIIGFIALILDGGAIMSNRRTAQASADSGALAGAQRLCSNSADAGSVAANYAILNGAEPGPTVTVNTATRSVTVETLVQHPSFFAKIFGQDDLPATARAVAGCFYPSSSDHILPIAFWYNTPPIEAKGTDCSDPTKPCDLVNWDFKELLDTLRDEDITEQPLPGLYSVSDKIKVCEQKVSGEIVCADMKDNASGGNRTWLNLSVVADNNTVKVIQQGLNDALYLPAWLNGATGTVSSVYKATTFEVLPKIPGYQDLPYRMMFVPVFDLFCERDPENLCSTDARDRFDYLANINNQSYRLVGFAPFVITCATQSGSCDTSTKSGKEFGECVPAKTGANTTNKDQCPGYIGYLATFDKPSDASKNSIEGYFVKNVPVDLHLWGTDGVDVGLYLISLTE